MSESELVGLAIEESKEKMAKAVSHAEESFAEVRTGRASPSLVAKLKVDYSGVEVPLQQLASFSVPDAKLLVITPYDKSSIRAIERALEKSELGITPSNDGSVIRLAFPPLTEERRRELVKVVRHRAEEGRVAVRNIRRGARDELKALEKQGEISSDELERAEKELEKLTHEFVEQIDRALAHKEQELMEV